MPTLAIVGAGPGLGLSIAKRFGAEGFRVALFSRDQKKLDRLAGELAADGIEAAGFAADVTDRPALTRAFDAAKERFGPIDVLEYSPAPADPQSGPLAPVDALDLTVEAVQPQIEYHLYGGITAIRQVLPDMLDRGEGTILVTTGASSGPVVHPPFANIAAASGALRNWVLNLNAALAPKGVYAAHIAIAAWIGKGGPRSHPDVIAESYWELYRARTEPELFYLDPEMRAAL
ncbi:SDR family NAD(P)-dependent oxidoreductase [Streptomyces rhizosphaericus]|uniref:SDR family NAD(P)-dependent oxidoreductase n=1 Tax=Streptomyces rhizosphaericus TaxID=114699 RepID=A0A6G4A966_9ACTN|nr:SDR family NAD(P)-dependent oxidoreductase [Streptomyces rhizosphaericus]NEW69241.1 SDR family NAD(P)-dependent oxidoreductase [Streptomyces rhizosphaericus]